jgi:hypothetical protein
MAAGVHYEGESDGYVHYLAEMSKKLGDHPALTVIHFLLTCMMIREDFPDVGGMF